jgi:hypothetical protein
MLALQNIRDSSSQEMVADIKLQLVESLLKNN